MLQDVMRGAPTEIGVINEAIVNEGERLGVSTPVNASLSAMVRAIEDSYDVRVSAHA
jgi:2-dehydropantoate 2-reductase